MAGLGAKVGPLAGEMGWWVAMSTVPAITPHLPKLVTAFPLSK